jgi:hypothetical protein
MTCYQALSVYNTINKARIPSRPASNPYVSASEKMKEETTRDFVNAAKKDPNNIEDQ